MSKSSLDLTTHKYSRHMHSYNTHISHTLIPHAHTIHKLVYKHIPNMHMHTPIHCTYHTHTQYTTYTYHTTPTCTPTAEFTYDKKPYLPALGLRHLGSARQWKSDANK